MKYLFGILLMMSAYTFAQNTSVYGLWVSGTNEYVDIKEDNSFERYIFTNRVKQTLAKGTIKVVNKEIRVIRNDTLDDYKLCYYLGFETMVVCRPRSSSAWLFQKLR